MFEFLARYKQTKNENFSFAVSQEKTDHFVSKILDAVKNGKKIFIWGDYDVDGIGATALMVDIIRDFSTETNLGVPDIQYHIPSRSDGYGINIGAFKALSSKADLIITLDNGTHRDFFSNLTEEEKKNLLIVDHHPNGDFKDEICVINPNVSGDVKICTGVLVELLFHALRHKNSEYAEKRKEDHFRDLVAMTLISDVASLNNDIVRKYISNGMTIVKSKRRSVFRQLLPSFKGDPSMTDLAFNVIPVINSIGRLSDTPSWAVDVLLAKDSTDETRALVDEAVAINDLRKQLTDEYSTKMFKHIEENSLHDDPLIHVHIDDVPIGINGIIASNIFNRFGRDVIVTSLNYANGGGIVGSGRGVAVREKLEAIAALQPASFVFGGHNQAVGIKIKKPSAFNDARKVYCDNRKAIGAGNDLAEKIFITQGIISVHDFKEACMAYNVFIGGDIKFAEQFFARVRGSIFSKKEYRNDFMKIGIVDHNTGEKIYVLSKRDDRIRYTNVNEAIFEMAVLPASASMFEKTIGTTLRFSDPSLFDNQDNKPETDACEAHKMAI